MAHKKKSNAQAASKLISVGRKLDHLLDTKILDATLDVLAEVGASSLTMDLVAARAGSGKGAIYRRWKSKSDLVIDAIAQLKRGHIDLPNLPDTGTLRGDLLALFKPLSKRERDRWAKIMSALASLVGQDQTLSDAANDVVVEPWAEAHLALMRRAVARGEIPESADLATISRIMPTMAAYRTLVLRKDFEADFLITMIDRVILPVFGLKP